MERLIGDLFGHGRDLSPAHELIFPHGVQSQIVWEILLGSYVLEKPLIGNLVQRSHLKVGLNQGESLPIYARCDCLQYMSPFTV